VYMPELWGVSKIEALIVVKCHPCRHSAGRPMGRVGQNHIHTVYIAVLFYGEIIKRTVIYGVCVCVRFWPTPPTGEGWDSSGKKWT
jgi:hypothetical protein